MVAAASPAGQINAIQKTGGQAVAVTFTTDDGRAASNLLVTSKLCRAPAGLAQRSGGFQCASVSTGNGCQLELTYAPTALASGTLTLNYVYVDDTEGAQSGTFDLPYAATTNDNVVATASPSGQINAVVRHGARKPFSVPCSRATTDDPRPHSTDQQSRRAAGGLEQHRERPVLQRREHGSSCQFTLTYAPAAWGNGTSCSTTPTRTTTNRPERDAQHSLSRHDERHRRRHTESKRHRRSRRYGACP